MADGPEHEAAEHMHLILVPATGIFLDLDDDVADPDACLPNYVGSFYNVAHTAPGGATERVMNITNISDLEVTVVEVDEKNKIDPTKKIGFAGFSVEYE